MRSTESEAQTWEPVSGMTVKRTVSSSRRTQAIFSRELRAATSSGGGLCQTRRIRDGEMGEVTRKGADIPEICFEPHFELVSC